MAQAISEKKTVLVEWVASLRDRLGELKAKVGNKVAKEGRHCKSATRSY